jgi:hypothetical protein
MAKNCFFIGPIGDAKSRIRKWSDQVLKYIVLPVVNELGYEDPIRSDLIPRSGSISFEIMRHLVEDDLVVADLTESNPNVFYELAICHILQKPVVHIVRDGYKLPFDVRDIRVISVKIDNLDFAEKTRREIKSQIISIEKDGVPPLPHILQIRQLKDVFESSQPESEKQTLLNLLEQLENIRFGLGEVKNELFDLNSELNTKTHESPSFSPFVERRLAKAETINKQASKRKKE